MQDLRAPESRENQGADITCFFLPPSRRWRGQGGLNSSRHISAPWGLKGDWASGTTRSFGGVKATEWFGLEKTLKLGVQEGDLKLNHCQVQLNRNLEDTAQFVYLKWLEIGADPVWSGTQPQHHSVSQRFSPGLSQTEINT